MALVKWSLIGRGFAPLQFGFDYCQVLTLVTMCVEAKDAANSPTVKKYLHFHKKE